MAQDISALAKRLLAELDTIKDIADTDERAAAFRAFHKKLSAAFGKGEK
jgi:hypothetical protein